MINNSLSVSTNDLTKSRLLLIGGISGIAIGIGYIIITIAFIQAGFPLPTDAMSWVNYLPGNYNLWWTIIWLSIITNLLYLPFAYILFELLKNNHFIKLLISLVLFTLFVFLELSITWSKYPALLDLVSRYHSISDGEMKLIHLAAIETVSAEFQTPVTNFYMIFIPSVATILACVAMFKTKLAHKSIVIIGFLSAMCNAFGSMGGVFIKPLGNLVVAGSFFVLFWFVGIGIALLRQRIKLIHEMSISKSENQ